MEPPRPMGKKNAGKSVVDPNQKLNQDPQNQSQKEKKVGEQSKSLQNQQTKIKSDRNETVDTTSQEQGTTEASKKSELQPKDPKNNKTDKQKKMRNKLKNPEKD